MFYIACLMVAIAFLQSLKLGMAESFLRKALEPPSEKAIGQAILTLRQLVSIDIATACLCI